MIKKLKKHLKKAYNYELESYALYKVEKKTNWFVVISHLLFIASSILFVLRVFFEIENFMSFSLYLYAFFLFELVPFGWVKGRPKYAILVTPRFLIQWNGGNDFVIMNYNNVTAFAMKESGISIKEQRHEIILSTKLFKEQVEPIIEILEAYGRTFDKTKAHMIRPISIVIENNIVKIIEEGQEFGESDSDLFNKYVDDYPSLTPGFLDQITFRNAIINKTEIIDDDLILNIESLVIREDHPENTTFGKLQAMDCVAILENYKVTYTDVKGFEGFSSRDVYELVKANSDATTISRVEHSEKKVKVVFSFGVQICTMIIEYEHSYVGWKKLAKKIG